MSGSSIHEKALAEGVCVAFDQLGSPKALLGPIAEASDTLFALPLEDLPKDQAKFVSQIIIMLETAGQMILSAGGLLGAFAIKNGHMSTEGYPDLDVLNGLLDEIVKSGHIPVASNVVDDEEAAVAAFVIPDTVEG